MKRSPPPLLALCAALVLAVACESLNVSRARTECAQTRPRDPDRAITGCPEYIEHARSGNPYVAQAYYNRGVAYQDKEDFEPALADYTEGTEDAALVLLFGLVAGGQIRLRRLDGWRHIPAVLSQRRRSAA